MHCNWYIHYLTWSEYYFENTTQSKYMHWNKVRHSQVYRKRNQTVSRIPFNFLQALHPWSFWLHLSKRNFRDVHNLLGTIRRHKKYDKVTPVSFRKSHRSSRWSKNLMNTFQLTSVSKNYLSTNMGCSFWCCHAYF